MIQPTPLLILILIVSWCRAIDVIPKKSEHDIYAIYANANSSSYYKTDVETSAYTIDHRVKEYGQFRYETRMADGVVYGCFGYNDAFGKLRSTHFVADHGGTRILRPFYPSKVYHSVGVVETVQWDEIELPKECQAHEILINVKPINFKTVADASKFQNPPQLSKVEALKKTVRNKPESLANQATPKSSARLIKLEPKIPTASGKQVQQRPSGAGKKSVGNEGDNSIAVSSKAGTVQKLSPQTPKSTTTSTKSVTSQRGGQKFSNRGSIALLQTGGPSAKGVDNVVARATAQVDGQSGGKVSGQKLSQQTPKATTTPTKTVTSQRGGQKFSDRGSIASVQTGGPSAKGLDNVVAKATAQVGGQSGVEVSVKKIADSDIPSIKTTLTASAQTGSLPISFSSPTVKSTEPSVVSNEKSPAIGTLSSKSTAPKAGISSNPKAFENGSEKTSEQPVGDTSSANNSEKVPSKAENGVPLAGTPKTSDLASIKVSGNGSPRTGGLSSTPQRETGNPSIKTDPDNGTLKTGSQPGAVLTDKVTESKISTFVKTSVPSRSGSSLPTGPGFTSPKNLDGFLPNVQKATPTGFSLPNKPTANAVKGGLQSSFLTPTAPGTPSKVAGSPKTVTQAVVGSAPVTTTKTQQKVSISLGKSGPSFNGVIDGTQLILKSGKPRASSRTRTSKITEGKPTEIEIVEDDDVAVPTFAPITSFTTPKFPMFGNQGFALPAGFSNPSSGTNNNFPTLPQGFTLPAGFPNLGAQSPNKTMIGNRVDTPAGNKPSAFGNFPSFPMFPTLPPLPNLPRLQLPTPPNFSGGSRTGNAINPKTPVNSVGPIEPIYDRKKIKEFKDMQQGLSPAPGVAKSDSKVSSQQPQQKTQKSASLTNPGSSKNPIPSSSIVGLPLNTKNILSTNIGGPINLPPGFSNASPNQQPLGNNVFGKSPSVTNILVGVPQEGLKPTLPIAVTGNGVGPEASGSNVFNQQPLAGKSPVKVNPAPAVQPLANRVQASAFISSTNTGSSKKGSTAKVQVSSPATGTVTATVGSVTNRGSFDLPQKSDGSKAQKMSGFNMITLPDAARPADVPADCPCLLMTSDKKQLKQSETPVTPAPMPQIPAVQQFLGQLPFAHGLPVLGFIPVLFVPYCNAGASTPVNIQSFGLSTALPISYPCSACT